MIMKSLRPVTLRAWSGGGCAVLLLVLSFSSFRHDSHDKKDDDPSAVTTLKWFEQAKAYYQAQSYHLAYGYFKDQQQIFLDLDEGCELMISTLAELKKLSSLEQISRECLNKAPLIAAEGLAMSLSQVGRSQEALEILEKLEPKHPHERLWATLSQLCVYNNQVNKAQDYLLRALQGQESWSVWFERALRQQPLHDPNFLIQVNTIVTTKSQIPKDQQTRWIQILKHHNLHHQAQIIESHTHP